MRLNLGTSIVEAMVALMVLAIVSSAVVLLTLSVLALNNSAKLKNQATAYAEQALEQVRGYYKTNGWSSLAQKGSGGGRCYVDIASWLQPPNNPACDTSCTNNDLLVTGGIFYRYVFVTTTSSQVKVTAVVSWLDHGICTGASKSTVVDTYFYNY